MSIGYDKSRKDVLRATIAWQVEQYLAAGGAITELGHGETAERIELSKRARAVMMNSFSPRRGVLDSDPRQDV